MTVLEWLQELGEEERIIKVGCVDNTLRGLRRCTARMAATSYLHWACPEYLAPQLGLAFECKSPAVNNEKFCERYKADCAQDAKRRAYEKQFAYMDSMPQTATALKKTLAPRRVGGQQ